MGGSWTSGISEGRFFRPPFRENFIELMSIPFYFQRDVLLTNLGDGVAMVSLEDPGPSWTCPDNQKTPPSFQLVFSVENADDPSTKEVDCELYRAEVNILQVPWEGEKS